MTAVNEIVEEFLAALQPQSSINTFKAYKTDLKHLSESFDSMHDLNENRLKEIRLKLIEKYSSKTTARRWSAWREFFRFCQMNGYLKQNPILNVEVDPANKPRVIKEALPPEMLEMVCNQPENLRDKALLWFIYSTGARPSEIVKYGILKNLNLAERQFQIPEPERITFLSNRAFELLSQYLQERSSKSLGLYDAIFVNDRGQPLSEMFLYTVFSQAAVKLGLKASVTDLRDSLILRLLRSGATPEQLKYLMGFKSIKSLEPIIHLKEAK